MKETCEGRGIVEVRVLQPMAGRDGVSPHQIPHTEIVESLVEREAGHGALKDMLRGGIWFIAIPAIVPGAGRPPPDMRIGRGMMRVADVRRIIMRDVIEVASIMG